VWNDPRVPEVTHADADKSGSGGNGQSCEDRKDHRCGLSSPGLILVAGSRQALLTRDRRSLTNIARAIYADDSDGRPEDPEEQDDHAEKYFRVHGTISSP
jgi:hypothetical protein